MKRRVFICAMGLSVLALTGCASLNGNDMVCGPQRNGITVFGNPDVCHVAMFSER